MVVAMLFALARGDATLLILPLLGGLTALAWTAIARVGAQAALILAPLCVVLLIILWIAAASLAALVSFWYILAPVWPTDTISPPTLPRIFA